MKKLLSVLAVLFVLGTTNVFAFGIGIQGGADLGAAGAGSAAVTFKLDTKPFIFAVNGAFYKDYVAFGGTADYWLGSGEIAGPLNYFYGYGLNAAFGVGNENVAFNFGPRIVGGLNLYVLDNFLEFYIQAAWQPTFFILPKFDFNLVNFPVAAGIRFWL